MALEPESEPDAEDVPVSGAVFTFGKSKFSDNVPSKFWLKNDKAIAISCGDEHTALITENGKLYVFGSNNWGQLGLGTKNIVNKPTCVKALKLERVKLAACGRSHTLVWTEQGNIYAAGDNSEGQLGLGNNEERTVFQRLEYFKDKQKIKQLAAGSNISAALTEDGNLFMWGDNSEGQIGLDSESSVSLPHQIDVGKPVSWVSCGYYHSALVTGDGQLYTFGESDNGKLGLSLDQPINHRIPQPVNNISGKVIQVSCGGGHTIVLTEEDVYAFGFGQFGQLGHGTFIFESSLPKVVESLKRKNIQFISCGENHTAVVTGNGLLYTFGDGRHGKLGLGEENFTNQFKPTLSTRFLKLAVKSVACGGCHMLVLATPRPKDSENIMIESDDLNKNYLVDTYSMTLGDLSTASTFHRSLSARVRRRERERSPEQFGQMVHTLPPIGASFVKSFHAGSRTIPGVKDIEKNLIASKPTINVQLYEESPLFNTDNEIRDVQESLNEEESEEESDKGLGDTIDPLNMTHTMMMNPKDKTLTLSPVHKEQVTSINKEQSESEDNEEDFQKNEIMEISAENEDAQSLEGNEDSESLEEDEDSESLEENEASGSSEENEDLESLEENEDADSIGEIEDTQNLGENEDARISGENEGARISGENEDARIPGENEDAKISGEADAKNSEDEDAKRSGENEDVKNSEENEDAKNSGDNESAKDSGKIKNLKGNKSNGFLSRTKNLSFFKGNSTKEAEGKIQCKKTKSEDSTKENTNGDETYASNMNCSSEGSEDISSNQNKSNFKSKYKSATCTLV
ncbi:X-linked retinitis pigmentosa GTPase regulator-like isoform X1 [Hypanus sabinus]|uniref:X-linked retinitis pigmentosa GTPase regulator-like isoform X1 n=1 Tax=Hypanus sabinus TaxID=79690 RepID=UPI0028C43D09|nr:X-linked retinitis pigmentosa GTPase regulator-like isoform X1 [Hypanus sabinus]